MQARVWESGLTRDFDLGRYTSEWRQTVNERIGIALDFDAFESVMLSALTVDDDTITVVHAIEPSVRVAVLTDNPPLLFSFQLGALKPSAEAFEIALDRLDVSAKQVLFIDDTPANADAARATGMEDVRVTSAAVLRKILDAVGVLRRR